MNFGVSFLPRSWEQGEINKVVHGNNHLIPNYLPCVHSESLVLGAWMTLFAMPYVALRYNPVSHKDRLYSIPVRCKSRWILNFPGKRYSSWGLQLELLTGLFSGSSHNLSIKHCDLHFMSSDPWSALELLQLNNYVSGMATISFSLMNLTDKCSCDNHRCRIWLLWVTRLVHAICVGLKWLF